MHPSRRPRSLSLTARQRLVLGGFALALLAALSGFGRLRVDNAPERFFVRDHDSLAQQAAYERLFGAERRVWIIIEGEDLWTRAGLETIESIERSAADLPGVVRTSGLWSRYRWLLKTWPPEDIGGFRGRASADPLGRSAGWVAPSGRMTSVLVEFEPDATGAELAALERGLNELSTGSLEFFLAGLPIFERSIDASMRRLVLAYLPALLVLAVLLLRFGFDSFRSAAAPLAFVAVVITGVLGTIGAVGQPLDMISVVIVPLLFVVALATAIHLQIDFGHHLGAGLDPPAAARAALDRSGRAVVWTALTTAIAFGSFAVSPVPPIRVLGLWFGAGLGWMLVAAFGLFPVLLEVGARPEVAIGRSPEGLGLLDRWARRWSPALIGAIVARRRLVFLLLGFLALVAAAGAARLRADSGLLTYFEIDHPARRGVARLEADGLAAGAAELVLQLPADTPLEARFRDPESLDRLAALADELRALEVDGFSVRGVLGAGDLYRAALADVVLEGAPGRAVRWMVLGLMQGDPDASARLNTLLADDGRAARLTVLVPLRGPADLDPLLAAARRVAEIAFPEAAVTLAGELPLLLAAQRHLVRSLVVSFGLTLGAIALILGAITRSASGALRALVANLWPVLVVFGAMGWMGTALDSTTVMIAAVVLGLAVDDTLHTLAQLRSSAGGEPEGAPSVERMGIVLARVAPAHALTSIVLAAGFAVCALSDFLPIARFGAFSAVGVMAALAGDLLLFPALLVKRD